MNGGIIVETKMLPKAILFDLDDTIISFDGVTNYAWEKTCKSFIESEKPSFDEKELLESINKTPPKGVESKDMLRYFGDEICIDLDILLITKQLWEQTLIYARYGAKARG